MDEVLKVLRWAYERSAFYRRRMDERGVRPEHVRTPEDFCRLVPSFTKEELVQDMSAHPPYGTILAVPLEELTRISVAPGPIVSAFSTADYPAMIEQAASALRYMGCRPGDIADNTVQYNWVLAGTFYDEALRRAGCVVLPGGAGQTELHVEYLKLTRATVLLGFPTFIEALVDVARGKGVDPARDLHIRLIIFGGELRRPDVKEYMSEAFGGADVREHYATADVGVVAYECRHGGGMHLMEGQYVEVLDPETGEPVRPGEPGEIVVTSTRRSAMPMIRYRTWDLTAGLDSTPCPCGAKTPRLGRIIGRVGNIPRVKGLFVNPKEVALAVEDFPELGRFQLVIDRPQRQDVLTLRVECRVPVPGVDRAALASRVQAAVKARVRLMPEVELVDAGAIGEDAPLVVDRRQV